MDCPGTLYTGIFEHLYLTRRIDSVRETSSRNVEYGLQTINKSVRTPSSSQNDNQPALFLSLAAVFPASDIVGLKLANLGSNLDNRGREPVGLPLSGSLV